MVSWDSIFIYALGFVALSLCYFLVFLRRSNNSPPGPTPLPIIGNAHQVPLVKQEEEFQRWAKQYGDIFQLTVFSQTILVLSSLTAARDLLDKRSSIYSDRPRFVLLSEMMGWEHASTHQRYGPRFRRHRRFINQMFNQRQVAAFRPLQEKELLTVLEDLINLGSRDFVDVFRRYAAATVLKITYGHDVVSVDDEIVRMVEKAGRMTIESGGPAASLVDFFPAMRHIPTWAPFSGFKTRALEVRKVVQAMMEIPFQRVKDDMKVGKAIPSYTSLLLNANRDARGQVSKEAEDDIKGSAGTLFAASEDTTLSVLTTFVLAVLLHPQVQRKAQEEIDCVVGRHRLPTLEDRDSLPYLECLMKEVLRWNAPVPLGLPHRLMEDDAYREFHFSKGSTILVNIYGILRDCSEPDRFYPERYLNDPELPDPHNVVFGFGRRICPGRYFGDTAFYMIASSVLASFDINKAVDAKGEEIIPVAEFNHGFVRHPKPFQCTFKPRSESLERVIGQAREAQEKQKLAQQF